MTTTEDFFGLRGFLGYEFKISEKSKLTENLNLFSNLETSSAWRANSVTALTAGFTDNVALKVSYTFDTTDTILVVALVVNF